MGWFFGWDSRKDLLAELTKEETYPVCEPTEDNPEPEMITTRAIAHCCTGNTFWCVTERTFSNGSRPTQRFLWLALMQNGGGRHGWGYKSLDETMGPCEVSCPPKYLDMVPCPDSEWARNWREEVRAHHAQKAEGRKAFHSLEVGDTVVLTPRYGGSEYTVTQTKPYVIAGGYRITPKNVAAARKLDRVAFCDLPEDMQELLTEACRHTFADTERLPVVPIPLSAFPEVPTAEGKEGDERYVADYVEGIETAPPVVVYGRYWIDGRHRVAAARKAGLPVIRAIDLAIPSVSNLFPLGAIGKDGPPLGCLNAYK